MKTTSIRSKRRAISGIVSAALLFSMIFIVGAGYFTFVSNTNSQYSQALLSRLNTLRGSSTEAIRVTSATSPSGHIGVYINNTGGVGVNLTSLYVLDPSANVQKCLGIGLPKSACTNGAPFPIYIDVGKGYPASSVLDTGFAPTSGVTYTLKAVSSDGIVSSTLYPNLPPLSVGGDALVVQMVSTPPQVFSGATVTTIITVYNYSPYPVTVVTPNPSPPTPSTTGTATLTGGSCSPASIASIAGYSGSGAAPSATFTCTFIAHTGAVGGFASFSGYVQGTISGASITSAQAISNNIQIGGIVPSQGPFSLNAFFFRYSACTNPPSRNNGQYYYTSACTTNPAPMPPAGTSSLPVGSLISGGSNYYVAFYIQLTNNFNTTLAVTEYSYVFLDPTNGGESSYYIVGQATSPQAPYYPNYASSSGQSYLPQLTPYTSTQITCAESPPSYNPPPPTTCIDISPGSTVVLTFAACGFGASNWSWGGHQYASSFDNNNGCTTVPPQFQTPEGTYLSIIISYIYKGVPYTQAIPFQGQIVLP